MRTGNPVTGRRPSSTSARRPAGNALLGRIGSLETRLACNAAEIAAAQELRHRVFSSALGAGHRALPPAGRDADRYDPACDHLLVIDRSLGGPDHRRVVGTYRLLRQEQAERRDGFYSQGEFDLAALIARHPGRRFLELGRSCVLEPYRSKRTLELLWQGIWAYRRIHSIDVMVGCASFPGTIPALHAEPLSFLAHQCRAGPDWDVCALPSRSVTMDLMPSEAIDARLALASMPPLIKGYLRLGAKVGDGCVIDRDFGTVDVFIVLPKEAISDRYIHHYGAEATRFAA
jgi:putative hemolysin